MDSADDSDTGLYAEVQTSVYTAPPITRGRVPKNSYGNLDVYVPSMVPPGGAHLAYVEAAQAARMLGIDYADAVTGFEFRGRHGTAVIKGIVVAEEYREAVEAVVAGFRDDAAQARADDRTKEVLRLWKRFLAGLRIRERIEGYEVEGERDAEERERAVDEENDDRGGFFPDRGQEIIAEPTAGRFHRRQAEEGNEDEADDDADAEEAMKDVEMKSAAAAPSLPSATGTARDDSFGLGGGGFLTDADLDAAGFIPEASPGRDSRGHLPVIDPPGGGFVPETAQEVEGPSSGNEDDGASVEAGLVGSQAQSAEPVSIRSRRGKPPLVTAHASDAYTSLDAEGSSMYERHGEPSPPPLPPSGSALVGTGARGPARLLDGSRIMDQPAEREHGILSPNANAARTSAAERDASAAPGSKGGDTRPPSVREPENDDLGNGALQSRAPASATVTESKELTNPAMTRSSTSSSLSSAISSVSDAASLLSHDPDDDDAEPAWLADGE